MSVNIKGSISSKLQKKVLRIVFVGLLKYYLDEKKKNHACAYAAYKIIRAFLKAMWYILILDMHTFIYIHI